MKTTPHPKKTFCAVFSIGLLLLSACSMVPKEAYLTLLHNEAVKNGENQGVLVALTLRDIKTKLSLTDKDIAPIKAAMVQQLQKMNNVEADKSLTADEKRAKISSIGDAGQIDLNNLIAVIADNTASPNSYFAAGNYASGAGGLESNPNGVGLGYR